MRGERRGWGEGGEWGQISQRHYTVCYTCTSIVLTCLCVCSLCVCVYVYVYSLKSPPLPDSAKSLSFIRSIVLSQAQRKCRGAFWKPILLIKRRWRKFSASTSPGLWTCITHIKKTQVPCSGRAYQNGPDEVSQRNIFFYKNILIHVQCTFVHKTVEKMFWTVTAP